MKRFFRIPIFLRGLAMGAADVVPGVSGGTIALLTGIYEELLESIKNLHPKQLKTLSKEGFLAFWEQINGSFLFSLALGIGFSILSLAKAISWALEHHPILVWSFFFGLVLASALYVGKQIKKWQFLEIALLIIGCGIAFGTTLLSPAKGSASFIYLFICGAIAICAMILPGISGSLILLLLGAYQVIFSNLSAKTILPVGLGAVIGILLFSRVLTWLFKNYRNPTLALLTGFILGALNKVWPWKKVITTHIDRHGVEAPLKEASILPYQYSDIHNEPHLLIYAILLSLFGFAIVFILEKLANS